MKNDAVSVPTSQDVRDELKVLLAQAEAAVSGSSSHPGTDLPANLGSRIDAAGDRVADLYTRAKDRVVAKAASTNASIRAHPYQSLAIAVSVGAIAGAIAGVLVGRRRS